jgi:ribosomal protein S18 acetylase RimI-like enzyme
MKKEDKTKVAPLIHLAIEDLADIFTQSSKEEVIHLRLEYLIEAQETRFSAEYGLVCEIEGQVVGAGFAYLGSVMKGLTSNSVHTLKQKGVSYASLDIERLLGSREANDDEFYIDNLAVYSNYQSRGIGKSMLEAFEKRAKVLAYNKVSILADVKNQKAKELYSLRGYKETGLVKVLGHEYHHLVKLI